MLRTVVAAASLVGLGALPAAQAATLAINCSSTGVGASTSCAYTVGPEIDRGVFTVATGTVTFSLNCSAGDSFTTTLTGPVVATPGWSANGTCTLTATIADAGTSYNMTVYQSDFL